MRLRATLDQWLLSPGATEQLERRVERLTETRADVVDHSAAELRRLERDLHDGAQARLVALSLSLGMADSTFEKDPDAARKLVSDARETTDAALGELRSVVRGIHPPVLADRGLSGAVQALALDMAVPVRVEADLSGRPPAPVESAVYFAVAECLANVGKHAQAENAWIRLGHADGVLRVEVGDDGHGGANPNGGTGMTGVMRTTRGVRRHHDGLEPGRRADDRHPGGPVRLVLAEDHALLRAGLIQLLEGHGFTVGAAVDNAADLDDALKDPDAEAAVLDVRLPPTQTDEGLRAAIAVRKERPGFPVMVLSQYVEHLYARELLASGEGAVGYLLKNRVSDVAEFIEGLQRVIAGGTVLDPEVVATVMAKQEPVDRLSAREREVMALMAEGRSNAAIAARLVVTEKAVAKHINSIFTKLDLPLGTDDHRRVRAVLTWLRL